MLYEAYYSYKVTFVTICLVELWVSIVETCSVYWCFILHSEFCVCIISLKAVKLSALEHGLLNANLFIRMTWILYSLVEFAREFSHSHLILISDLKNYKTLSWTLYNILYYHGRHSELTFPPTLHRPDRNYSGWLKFPFVIPVNNGTSPSSVTYVYLVKVNPTSSKWRV